MHSVTENSGMRIFHQVNPSGREGSRRVLKLIPGKSVQACSLIHSSLHEVSSLSPQCNAPTVSPNTTSRGQGESPLSAPGQSYSISLKAPVQLPFSESAQLKTFQPTSLLESTTATEAPSQKSVLAIPKSNSFQIVEHHGQYEDSLGSHSQDVCLPSSCSSASIRTFLKVTPSPQRPNSPLQWLVEDNVHSQNPSSASSISLPTVDCKVLEVIRKRELGRENCRVSPASTDKTASSEKQSDFSVVMFDDKIFFQTKKEGELIDLCCDEVCTEGTPADEDGVTFVSYTPAPAVPRVENRTGTCTRTAPTAGGRGAALTDCTQAPRHTEGHTQRGLTHQPQISSGSPQAPYPVADHRLKQMFGIMSEVEIRLQRVTSQASQVPPLDYTEPIEEDFLCAADLPHSQDCPKVEGSASRVGRTRKRTKCPCCSPAILHRYHHAQKRRAKPGHGERKEMARRQLKLQPIPETTPTMTATETAPQVPRKQAKLKSPPETAPTTTTTETAPQAPRKQAKLKSPPETAPATTATETAPQVPRKQAKLKSPPETAPTTTATETAPQIPRKQAKLKSPPETAPTTTTTETAPQAPRKQAKLKSPPETAPTTTATETTPQVPWKQAKLKSHPETAPTTTATETASQVPRKQAKLKSSLETAPTTTATETAPQVPRKQAKLKSPPETAPTTTTAETSTQVQPKQAKLKTPAEAPLTTTAKTASHVPRKQAKLKPPPETAPTTTAEATPPIQRKRDKLKLPPETAATTATDTTPLVQRKQAKLKTPLEIAPTTTSPSTTPQVPQEPAKHIPQRWPPMVSSTVPLTTTLTTPVISQQTAPMTPHTTAVDEDSEEMQIHKEIELLRETLRLKEAALEKLQSHKER